MPGKTKSHSLLIIVLLVLSALLLTGCLPSRSEDSFEPQAQNPELETEIAERAAEEAADRNSEYDNRPVKGDKLIKNGRLEIEASELDERQAEVNQLVEDQSGYISNSRQQTRNNRRIHSYTIRVPADNFSILMSNLQQLGEVEEKQISTRDVTEEYTDLQTRKENLTAQEKRYRELLEEAGAVEDILKIEKELNRVRTEIEQIQNRLDHYDNKVNLSTIQLRISEPESLFTNRQLPNSLHQAVRGFITSIHLIIIFIGRLLPWFILLIAGAAAGYKSIKKWRS